MRRQGLPRSGKELGVIHSKLHLIFMTQSEDNAMRNEFRDKENVFAVVVRAFQLHIDNKNSLNLRAPGNARQEMRR